VRFRRWERAGWSIAVGVPDEVAARARRFARNRSGRPGVLLRSLSAGAQPAGKVVNVDAQGRALVLADPPAIRLERRDPVRAVEEFLGHAPPTAENNWYHTIELPGGNVTDGRFDHRPLVPHYGLPESMSGMRVLDVGTSDGFWAFEMERRGAEVVALELARVSDRDLPGPARRIVAERFDATPGRRFELAREALGSKVELVRGRIYDLDPSALGTFDFVHAGDILLHVRDQVAALKAIRSVTSSSGQAHIADAASPSELGDTLGHMNLTEYHGGWRSNIWWTPSVQTLAQMTVDAGFTDVQVRGLYRLDIRGTVGGWRAILRARA
jgi:tRNA (mo5U34)-methyltransferase